MQQVDAYKLLNGEMATYLELAFDDLKEMIGESSSRMMEGDDSRLYVIEVAVSWRCQRRNEILIEGMVALAGTGPLRRIDHSAVVTPAGVIEV